MSVTRPAHLPLADFFTSRARPSAESPLRVMLSACLGGARCGVDGGTNGDHAGLQRFLARPEVALVRFCPEDFAFGTPRKTPDLHGGDGFDVLDGRARALADDGEDWSEGMIRGAYAMRDLALREGVELAILMDISGACGSTVVYLGSRFAEEKRYQRGPGVAAAALMRAGVAVISQRDERSLERLRGFLDGDAPDGSLLDHWEKPWFQGYFADPSG